MPAKGEGFTDVVVAVEIRNRYRVGLSTRQIAAQYGISRSTVREIIIGRHPTVRGRVNLSRGRGRPARGVVPV